MKWSDVPAENSEDEVHDEERTDDDEADEVDPGPRDAHSVVDLTTAHSSPVNRQADVKNPE